MMIFLISYLRFQPPLLLFCLKLGYLLHLFYLQNVNISLLSKRNERMYSDKRLRKEGFLCSQFFFSWTQKGTLEANDQISELRKRNTKVLKVVCMLKYHQIISIWIIKFDSVFAPYLKPKYKLELGSEVIYLQVFHINLYTKP